MKRLTTLEPLLDNTCFYRAEASYLSAVAATRQFALAANPEGLTEDALKNAKRQFSDLFQANDRWRERGKSDLADILGTVPKKASDDLARSVLIAAFLEELNLADTKQLAKELVARLRTSVDNHHGLEHVNAAMVRHVLRLDPLQSGDVITVVLSEADENRAEFRARLLLVQQWANDQPPLAKTLAGAMLEHAGDPKRAAKDQPVELMLDAAEEICPELREQCAQQRLGWLKIDLANRDYAGAVRRVARMRANATFRSNLGRGGITGPRSRERSCEDRP